MFAMAALGALMAFACVLGAIFEIRRTGEILSPLILFLGLSVLDVYLPAVVFAVSRPPDLAPWLDRTAVASAMPSAVVIFTVGLAIFIVGYTIADRWPASRKDHAEATEELNGLGTLVAGAAFAIAVTWYVWSVAYRSAAVGSFANYIANGLVLRWQAESLSAQYPEASALTVLALEIGSAMLAVITLTALILVTTRFAHPLIRLVLVPSIGLAANLVTFFRGSLLSYFISFAAVADRRRYLRRPSSHAISATLIVIGVLLFLGYGVIRNAAVLAAQHEAEARIPSQSPTPGPSTPGPSTPGPSTPGPSTDPGPVIPGITDEAVNYEAGRILKGEGLIGLAAIVAYYPTRQPFIGGATIRDMLLLPIPRSLWRDKPAWYGIAQITRGEGEPSSTQSAVTIQGELYANFGTIGIVGMVVYGALFGLFHRFRNGRRFRYAYAAIVLPLVFVTFWMSTTGLINGLLPLAPASLVLFAVFPPRFNANRVRATRLRSSSA